ncbi:MAG: EI24 domain-containing protein [Bacteriovoracaceae bacterium]|nr:EI24 domain-containing protein [Bacteriovoracaceae bacterium]
MQLILSSIKETLSIFRKDKVVLLFSMLPIFIGIMLYSLFGTLLFGGVFEYGNSWIHQAVAGGTWGSILSYLLIGMLSVILFFTINFTFFLFVSIIACPFNDLISERVERLVGGQPPISMGESISKMFKRFFKVLLNELKKISLILVLVLIAFGLSFIPIFVPVSIGITALLLAIEFLDYSWGRHGLTFSQCFLNLKSSIFLYIISGCGFLFLMSIPVINLLSIPMGVIYFTILYTKNLQKQV